MWDTLSRAFSGLSDEHVNIWQPTACEQILTDRCQKLGAWLRIALNRAEVEIQENMLPCRRRILEPKRIAFMRYVIESEGYDDKLLDDLEHGLDLVGDAPKSSVLPTKLVPATITRQDLDKQANKALRCMIRSSGDLELDNLLWEKTQSEVAKGWMIGPLCGTSFQLVPQYRGGFLLSSLVRCGLLMTCLRVR